MNNFHGSYTPQDVTFLLKQLLSVENLPPIEKERMIQSGERHYSEMLNQESLPSSDYMQVFWHAMQDNAEKMAQDCMALTQTIKATVNNPIIVSLARAGTPVGVVMKHLLSQQLTTDVPHYSVSIIRDRGIDSNAIHYILDQHKSDGSNLVFVDGWTGKGVITRELTEALEHYNQLHDTQLQPHLYVLSDLAGVAWQSASFEDYLIPSAILNSTVSGLISRSVLDKQIQDDDFHGCVFYQQFLDHDVSQQFVKILLEHAQKYHNHTFEIPSNEQKISQQQQMQDFIKQLSQEFAIDDINLIKPGIGEATRVLLRRVPERLIVRDVKDTGIKHLLVLAQEKSVIVEERATLPFRAVSLIRSSAPEQ